MQVSGSDSVMLKDGVAPAEASNCKGCDCPDDAENMVACDKCSAWWHLGCVGVQESICDRSWKCNECTTFCASVVSAKSTASLARLKHKQLEEEKALFDLLAQRDRDLLTRKHLLELEVVAGEGGGSVRTANSRRSGGQIQSWVDGQNREKMNPTATHTSTPIVSSAEPAVSAPAVVAAISRESNDLRCTLPPLSYFGAAVQPTNLVYTQGSVPANEQQNKVTIKQNCTIIPVQQSEIFPQSYTVEYYPHPPPLQHPNQRTQYPQHPQYSLPKPTLPPIPSSSKMEPILPAYSRVQANCQLQGIILSEAVGGHLPASMSQTIVSSAHQLGPITSQSYISAHYIRPPTTVSASIPPQNYVGQYSSNPAMISGNATRNLTIPGQLPANSFPSQYSAWPSEAIISPQQLAARHVVSKELPKFSGDPLEWPMFLNAFQSTTAMCGIQPDENLARLQKVQGSMPSGTGAGLK